MARLRRGRPSPPQGPSLFETPAFEPDPAAPPVLSPGHPQGNGERAVPLHEAAQTRYLNYALSVITARALPDVRDGLKPVQRRILYTMWRDRLTSEAKFRKCAKVVGDVMGAYHPHGDAAIYETLARMAQPFTLRYPLVDGSGNFGSLDGDEPAAMRYTECRLTRLSEELLAELDQDTVPFRPNYDGTRTEPVVLPARFPNLLVNGASGIAVGMATSIPPHNLGEVATALLKLLENEDLTNAQLCRYIKGPDFPTGGQILNTPEELRQIYRTGSGTLRVRGTWDIGPESRSTKTIYIDSIPYTVNKAQLVERIGEIVASRKLPPLLDVKDLSTDEVRIALDVKKDADERLVMAYLYKHTPLQVSVPVNLTCLVPTENPEVGRPERLDLKSILWHFLHHRLEVVTRRLEHELAALKRRIHILEGFELVFDALDEAIRIVRKAEGRVDAASKLKARFRLDDEQVEAVLELKIYRLARLEIAAIREELTARRTRARQIAALLREEASRWRLVRQEIEAIQQRYADQRRTLIAPATNEPQFTAEDFIVEEDNVVIVTRDGWVKRQKEVKDLATTRLREGDSVLAALAGSTKSAVVFFTNFGVAYTCRIVDVPPSTGYGEPIQRLFKFRDGERVIAAVSLDPRATPDIGTATSSESTEGEAAPAARSTAGPGGPSPPSSIERRRSDGTIGPPPTHALAVTSDGYSWRFSLAAFVEPSARTGRRFARLPEGAEVVDVTVVHGHETVIAATRQARALLCRVEEIKFLAGPGRGVRLLKLAPDDRVLGSIAATSDRDALVVETSRGARQTISTGKYGVTQRGGRGRRLLQRGQLTRILRPEVAAPPPLREERPAQDESR